MRRFIHCHDCGSAFEVIKLELKASGIYLDVRDDIVLCPSCYKAICDIANDSVLSVYDRDSGSVLVDSDDFDLNGDCDDG